MNVNEFCKQHNITLDQFYGKETIPNGLDLRLYTELPDGFNPYSLDSINLYSLEKIPNGFNPNPIVGGYLNLYSLTKLPNNFNPIVGGNLNLYSVKELPNNFNPIVGGDLHLYSLKKLPEGFNPKCKTIVYNKWKSKKELNTNPNYILFNNYIKTDNLYKIIEQKGNQFKVQELTSDKIFYIITDDKNYGQSEYLVDALINLKNKSLKS